MRARWLAAIALVSGARAQAAPASADLVETGRRLVEKAECGRCHALPATVASTPRPRSCAGCHAWIHATREDPAAAAHERQTFPLWDRYMASVASFLEVPDLGASAARLEPAFVARYLRAPFKVRPALPEEMIRTGFSDEEAAAVAAWLAATTKRTWSAEANQAAAVALSAAPAHVAEGKRLYERFACGTCHALADRAATGAGPPAPDLAFVRERLAPGTAAAFIADPAAIGGETRMPRYLIAPVEAARLRDYLWSAATARALPTVPEELPLLARPVAYAEVRAQVLDRICIHCHMDARKNGGEGGPGNTGGLGYRGVKLDLESWAGIQRGAVDARGRRVSILEGGEGAPLLARLRARYLEHVRERAGSGVLPGGAPGMPLGLPPLDAEQFQLVRSWVAQGAPGPVRRIARGRGAGLKIARGPAEGPKQ